jgi:hypothetical protein
MSTPSQADPQAAPAPAGGNDVAVEYVQQQLHHARVAFKRTQLVGIILIALITASISYLTTKWRAELNPKAAAKTAVDQLSARVIEHADELSDQLKQKAPQYIAGLPDMVLRELPARREELEKHLTTEIHDYCRRASKTMDKHLDQFFLDHKADIVEALKAADNKDALRALGTDLQDQIVGFLSEKPEQGESIKEKIDQALELLRRVEKTMDKLASGTDLTPQEKKARRAIAILTHHVDRQFEKEPVKKTDL